MRITMIDNAWQGVTLLARGTTYTVADEVAYQC